MGWQPDYVTAEQLAEYAKANADADAEQLAWAVTAASREVDRFCFRQFGQGDAGTVRTYDARWSAYRRMFVADVDDCFEAPAAAAVEVDTTGCGDWTTVPNDPVPLPLNAPADGLPFTVLALPGVHLRHRLGGWGSLASLGALSGFYPLYGRPGPARSRVLGAVRITHQWGWPEVPVPVEQAALLQGNRLLFRRDSPMGIAGSPEAGSELRLLAKVDPDVFVMLSRYVRQQRRLG